MKRRIIKQGHSTLTITLPSDWTKRFNLQGGAEVDVLDKDNGLFITTEKNDSFKVAEFDITGMDIPTVWKYFMSVYREGYDEVLIKYGENTKLESPYEFFTQNKLDSKYGNPVDKKSVLEFMHEIVNRFIGFEIVEHGKGFVRFRELSEATSKEFDNSLRRVFLLIQQMSEETCEALKTGDAKILSHIHDVDINLDKFHDYCIRILNKTANKETRKTSLLFSTLYLLELMGDEYKNIAHHFLYDFKKVDCPHISDIAESIHEQLNLYYDLFYKFDRAKAIKISEIDQGRYFSVEDKIKRTKSENEKEIFHHLRIVTRYINALTELRIEMEF